VSRESRVPMLQVFYRQFLEDGNTMAFVRKASTRYAVGTLERLLAWGNRQSRRAAVLALGYLGDFESNPAVGRALVDSDRGVRLLAETAIRSLWCRAGSENQQEALSQLIRLNNARRYEEVLPLAGRLLDCAPWYAEAWNQRAIARYGLKRFDQAIDDCRRTLQINPFHFGAATGMGYCHLQRDEPQAALECFRRALRLNPGLETVRAQLVKLQRSLKEKGQSRGEAE
jgi:tetratricopeptide (TPR) repeat protein